MNRIGLAAIAVAAASATASADPPVAYVEIVVSGGPDAMQGRQLADSLLRRAGLRATFADSGTVPCGDDAACLADRARSSGAVIAVRLTIADVAGRTVVSMVATDAGHTIRREIAQDVDASRPDDRLAALLRDLVPTPRSRRRTVAWSLVGVTGALVIGGLAATWYAHDLRGDFFAEHVASNGDVFGISPAGARAEEARARRWSILGGVTLAGAAITGTTAVVLFVRGPSGESRPAGVALAVQLP